MTTQTCGKHLLCLGLGLTCTEPVSPTLLDYATNETIRRATDAELAASIAAAELDGGAGVIEVDGRRCYAVA